MGKSKSSKVKKVAGAIVAGSAVVSGALFVAGALQEPAQDIAAEVMEEPSEKEKTDKDAHRVPVSLLEHVSADNPLEGIRFYTLDDLVIPENPQPLVEDTKNEIFRRHDIIDAEVKFAEEQDEKEKKSFDISVKDPEKLTAYLTEKFAEAGYSMEQARTTGLDGLNELLLSMHKVLRNNMVYFEKAYEVRKGWSHNDKVRSILRHLEHELFMKSMDGIEVPVEEFREELEKRIKEGLTPEEYKVMKIEEKIDGSRPEDLLYEGVAYCRHFTRIYSMIFNHIKGMNPNLAPVEVNEVYVYLPQTFSTRPKGKVNHAANSVLVGGKNASSLSIIDTTGEHDQSNHCNSFVFESERIRLVDNLLWWPSTHLALGDCTQAANLINDALLENPKHRIFAAELLLESISFGYFSDRIPLGEEDVFHKRYGQLEKAAEIFAESKPAEAYSVLAEALLKMSKRYDYAGPFTKPGPRGAGYFKGKLEETIKKLEQHNPEMAFMYSAKLYSGFVGRDWKKAEQACYQLARYDIEEACHSLADIVHSGEEYDAEKALGVLDEFLKQRMHNGIMNTKGKVLSDLGRYEESIKVYEELLKDESLEEKDKKILLGNIEYVKGLKQKSQQEAKQE